MIQPTSIQAYQEILPTLGERQRSTIDALERFNEATGSWPTAYELERWDHVEYRVHARRLSELLAQHLVHAPHTRECQISEKTAMVWVLGPAEGEEPLAKAPLTLGQRFKKALDAIDVLLGVVDGVFLTAEELGSVEGVRSLRKDLS